MKHVHQATLVLILSLLAVGCSTNTVFDVKQYGASGDGTTLETAALQSALDACHAAGGGTVIVPAGNYLVGSVVMKSNTTLRIEKGATLTGSPDKAHYPLMNIRWEGRWREGHRALIHAQNADHIAIEGEGTIVGDPQLAYLRDPRGPCIIEPIECRNVRIEGLSIRYVRMWAVHLTYCQDVVARKLHIRSEPKPSNGDGIDVDSCRKVLIEDCDIDCGDDAIALKSGRGMEAVRIGRPTEEVTIRNCRLGSTFAAVALGTEMSGGLRNIRVENCTFTRGVNGIYIKSRTGRGGFIEDAVFSDLTSTGARAFLRIDLMTKGIQDSEPVEGPEAFPRVSNIRVENAMVTCDTLLDATRIAPERPLAGFTFRKINGTCRRSILLRNMHNVELRDIDVTGYNGPLVSGENVTGSGLDDMAPLPPTTRPSTRPISAVMQMPSSRPSFQVPKTPINPSLPTLWLIGDSTVRNGRDTGDNGQWGWGNPIASYFDQMKLNVQNRAVGGTSSRTFMRDHWPWIMEELKPGDYLIMQFGHNDSGALNDASRARGTIKNNSEETQEVDNQLTGQHEVVHSYGWYLRKYIADARSKGVVACIVCSPIPRNRWTDGKINRDTGYSVWGKQAAEQVGAFYINLNQLICDRYDALGQPKVTAELFPENETVHPDWAGSILNAECVIEGLKSLEKCDLSKYLLPEPPKDLRHPSGRAR